MCFFCIVEVGVAKFGCRLVLMLTVEECYVDNETNYVIHGRLFVKGRLTLVEGRHHDG